MARRTRTTTALARCNILAFITLLAAVSGAVDETERGWALGIGNAGVALSVFIAGLLTSALVVLPIDAFLALGGVIILTGILPALRLTTGAQPSAEG